MKVNSLKESDNNRNFFKGLISTPNRIIIVSAIITIVAGGGILAILFEPNGNTHSGSGDIVEGDKFVSTVVPTNEVFFNFDNFDKDSKLFTIEPSDRVAITKASWSLPGKLKGEWNRVAINGHPKYLSWYEIRNLYAWEMEGTLDEKENAVECGMFPLISEGIPVLVTIDYDTVNQKRSQQLNLLLLTRLDTNNPFASVQHRDINLKDDANLVGNFFNRYLDSLDQAIELGQENIEARGDVPLKVDGKCTFLFNQPVEGY